MARFKVAWLVEISGRGTAIAGEIVDGVVGVGDHVVGPAVVPGLPFPIRGVEVADRISPAEWGVRLIVPQSPGGNHASARAEGGRVGWRRHHACLATKLEVVSAEPLCWFVAGRRTAMTPAEVQRLEEINRTHRRAFRIFP